eukprot:TRINITY_DN1662_c0_g1_i1.p2 TRINITY_DN1662_c0_g1~~TRINITY_DN1662_c0_g1_i1.p2  ORF type:complete len:258 (+),score=38.00 TRINITY_DN1662_c0_g1_i1:114-887(+)
MWNNCYAGIFQRGNLFEAICNGFARRELGQQYGCIRTIFFNLSLPRTSHNDQQQDISSVYCFSNRVNSRKMASNNKQGMQAPPNYQAGTSNQQNRGGANNNNNRNSNGGQQRGGNSKYDSAEVPSGWNASYSDTGRSGRTSRTNVSSSSRAPVPEGVDVFEFAGGAYRSPTEDVDYEEKYKFFGNSKKIQYVPNYSEDRLKKAAKLVATQGTSFQEAARVCNVTQKDLRYYYDNHNNDILSLPKEFDPFGEEDDVYI